MTSSQPLLVLGKFKNVQLDELSLCFFVTFDGVRFIQQRDIVPCPQCELLDASSVPSQVVGPASELKPGTEPVTRRQSVLPDDVSPKK